MAAQRRHCMNKVSISNTARKASATRFPRRNPLIPGPNEKRPLRRLTIRQRPLPHSTCPRRASRHRSSRAALPVSRRSGLPRFRITSTPGRRTRRQPPGDVICPFVGGSKGRVDQAHGLPSSERVDHRIPVPPAITDSETNRASVGLPDCCSRTMRHPLPADPFDRFQGLGIQTQLIVRRIQKCEVKFLPSVAAVPRANHNTGAPFDTTGGNISRIARLPASARSHRTALFAPRLNASRPSAPTRQGSAPWLPQPGRQDPRDSAPGRRWAVSRPSGQSLRPRLSGNDPPEHMTSHRLFYHIFVHAQVPEQIKIRIKPPSWGLGCLVLVYLELSSCASCLLDADQLLSAAPAAQIPDGCGQR